MILGQSWKQAARARYRQDVFDFSSPFGGGGFDSGGIDTSIDAGQASPADASISDQVRSSVGAVEIPWGTGPQAAAGGSPPVMVDSNSISDRLRGIAAAAESPSQADALLQGSGGSGYDPTQAADPVISAGTMDWPSAFDAFAKTAVPLAGSIATITNGIARLAGVGRTTVVTGNPAPGGAPGPSFLQRVLGGGNYNPQQPGTPVAGAALGGTVGPLLMIGLVVGIGWLVLKR